MGIIAVFVAAFFLGAVPFGYLIGRLNGVDVRAKGSGNIGTSNVLRTVGAAAAASVLIFDVFKAAVPVWVAAALGYDQTAAFWAGTAAVLGHTFSPFLRFKGGRGVASTLGVVIAAAPWVAVWCAAIWLVLVALTRFISLGSLVAAAAVPVILLLERAPTGVVAAAVLLFLLILLRHQPNIKRLVQGNENRIGERAK
ncbi:MAG TPA: glycerol-3-phosphate 1-O-acyltransferase PlsY [Limnochordia bacterium]|nr:glycerol-3-phosphate 1-O-acyltransferase PlsY [Limnochordia bacterium]